MKKVLNPTTICKQIFLSIVFVIVFSSLSNAQTDAVAVVDAVKGKEIFNANCAACHSLDKKMTGPALRGISTRLTNKWIQDWVHNSAALIKAGDNEAVRIFKEYNSMPMTAFPQLTNEDIDNIIAYTSEVKADVVKTPTTKETDTASSISNDIILGGLIVLLLVVILVLLTVKKTLSKISADNEAKLSFVKKKVKIWEIIAKNQFLAVVFSILFLLVSAFYMYEFFMQVGVDQGYSPVQPIHFSHKIHAGSNGINCNYCHSAARVSKNAGIPSLNVCMNCHKNISEVSDTTATAEHTKKYYDAEIQKLYTAVGWKDGKYTGKTEPVKWVRIHNLQDFVYFNHSQHVTVAGLECQSCHGPVQTYEVQKQFAKLTMGWCVDCHRKTEVKMEGNEYYTKIHEELSKKYGVEKLTAAEMGGLECGKCHY